MIPLDYVAPAQAGAQENELLPGFPLTQGMAQLLAGGAEDDITRCYGRPSFTWKSTLP